MTLQTTEGFLGKGNYGVARMNGGFASRPQVGVARGPGFVDRFARDVRTWLDARRESLISLASGTRPDGIGLLWCEPWDGTTSLRAPANSIRSSSRCVGASGSPSWASASQGRGVSTEAARVDGKASRWASRATSGSRSKRDDAGKALTVSANGFNYVAPVEPPLRRRLRARAAAQSLRPEDGDAPVLIARVLARGQGETNGLHERVLELPADGSRPASPSPPRAQRLGALAQRRVEQVGGERPQAGAAAGAVRAGAGGRRERSSTSTDKRPDPFDRPLRRARRRDLLPSTSGDDVGLRRPHGRRALARRP
ncbi:MAG: hypothetical protein V9F06_00195 [Thermomicrobiales bacterium]